MANRLITTPYGGGYLKADRRYTLTEKGQAYLQKAKEMDDLIAWHGNGLIPEKWLPGYQPQKPTTRESRPRPGLRFS